MLLFDAGNSRCKWVLIKDGIWMQQGVVDNTDELAWHDLKEKLNFIDEPEQILVSNVAGIEMAQRLRELCASWQCIPEFIVAKNEQCGVQNSYEVAAQLGSDRWAALIGARHLVKGACLVVNCGTATTIDSLLASGEFVGGLILPGMDLMMRSLRDNTAQLESDSGNVRDFPSNTNDAMLSGALKATVCAIQHQFQLMSDNGKAVCIVSGGAAHKILPYLEVQVSHIDDLVLRGLQIMGQGCLAITKKETVAK